MKGFYNSLMAVLLSGLCAMSYAKCTVDEVHDFEMKWKTAYDTNDPEKITNYYTPDGIFIGAFSHEPLLTPKTRRAYFTKLFSKEKQKLTVHFDKKKTYIHLIPGGAISSGVYILERNDNGVVTKTPIRFTMIYRDTPKNCELIVHHASLATQ